MGINLIVAVADNGVIGNKGSIPWKIPGELAYFKEVTMGHSIVMGRKTFESIGSKGLPGRKNYVLTHNANFKESKAYGKDEYYVVCHNLEEVLKATSGGSNRDIFIIGGAKIYEMFMPHADKVYLTRVHFEPEGDTFFGLSGDWNLVSSKEGPSDVVPHTFEVYERDKRGTKAYPKEIICENTTFNLETAVGTIVTFNHDPKIEAVIYGVDKDGKLCGVVSESRSPNYKNGDHILILHTKEHLFEKEYEVFKSKINELEHLPVPSLYAVITMLQLLIDKGIITEHDLELMKAIVDRDGRAGYFGKLFL